MLLLASNPALQVATQVLRAGGAGWAEQERCVGGWVKAVGGVGEVYWRQ